MTGVVPLCCDERVAAFLLYYHWKPVTADTADAAVLPELRPRSTFPSQTYSRLLLSPAQLDSKGPNFCLTSSKFLHVTERLYLRLFFKHLIALSVSKQTTEDGAEHRHYV